MEKINWAGRKVFVTGATGLVGSWLVAKLVDLGAQVTILVQDIHAQSILVKTKAIEQVHCVYGELENFALVQKALQISEADTILHLGAQTIVDHAILSPMTTFESNIRGTYHVLEAARALPTIKSIVVASTDKAYGESKHLPYTEDMPLNGTHPYDASKVCLEIIAQSYVKTYGLPIILVRCGNIFGGGDVNFSRLIPSAIQAFLNQQSPILRSDGTFVRDYVYVKNVVEVYLLLAALLWQGKAKGEVFNYSDDNPKTVLEVVAMIADIMNTKHIQPTILNTAKAEIHDQILSSQKLRRYIELSTLVDMRQALIETIAWYREFFRK